jgi:hypothetical protein
MKKLFDILKVKNTPHKHWLNSTGWKMVENMHQIIIESTKTIVQKAMYLLINCDEVTTINNQSWCNVHAYVVGSFKMIPLLLNLEKVIGGSNANNLIQLMEYGGLTSN